jgi:uncharacterized membrane protein
MPKKTRRTGQVSRRSSRRRAGHVVAAGRPIEPAPTDTSISHPSLENIETIVRLEEEAEREGSFAEIAAETIGRFAGTLAFVAVQVAFVTIWLIVNLGATPLSVIDPYPFVFLAGILAFETVILTAFVLIRQNRMSVRAERRNHLNLQISLLSEREVTKIIQMLERLSQHAGAGAVVVDREAHELGKQTQVEGIAEQLREKLEGDKSGA